MKHKILISLLFTAVVLLLNGCSSKWKKAFQRGEVITAEFKETIGVEVRMRLMIVPVTIEGKTYRFLLDTGAPFSISEELQENLNFDTISRGSIRDTEHNKKEVALVRVDSIMIGNIPFTVQSALVLGFQSNPILKCMGLDGIVGSNLMRFCNWKIDFEKEELSLSNNPGFGISSGQAIIPFSTDNQYNIFTKLAVANATIKPMTIDYGSNGSISVPKKVFQTLKEKQIVDHVFFEKGVSQRGILGEINELNREITYFDTIRMNNFAINNVEMISSNSSLIGTKVLSRFTVVIDWEKQQLRLSANNTDRDDLKTFGFRMGYSEEKKIHIHSVIEGSPAFKNGIRPDMEILKIDTLRFSDDPDTKNNRRRRIPENFKGSLTIQYNNYVINQGLEDSIFDDENGTNEESIEN